MLPRASASPVGALGVIYGMADRLAERGHRIELAHPGELANVGADAHPWYRSHPAVQTAFHPDLETVWPAGPAEAIVATSWQTVPWVARYPTGKGAKLYWLQDYETYILGSRLERELVRRSLAAGWPTVVTSPALRRLAQRHAAGPVIHIPCAIDTEVFNAIVRIEAPERDLIGFPARPEPAKRTGDALRALQQVRAIRPAIRAWCFGYWRPQQLPEWISHHHAPSTADLRDLYNRTRIFVVPSECEGFGLPGLEAMACGATLVSTRNGGVGSYADQRSALLCPPRDSDCLAKAILRLLEHDELRSGLAYAGTARASRFTWERTVSAFEHFIRSFAKTPMIRGERSG